MFRLTALLALAGALVGGGLAAVKSQGATRRPVNGNALARTRAGFAPVTFAAPSDAGGPAEPVATVIPPQDGGGAAAAAPARPWPPALLNPGANLRNAWDLALGRPNAREVLFTFDDGPNPGTTDRLLGYLDRYHYKAIFFVCGWRLETDEPLRSRARALLREEIARGHIVGNHTVHHRNMATLTPQQVAYEVDHNADLINEVIGQRPHLFRPPYGSYSEDVRSHVEGLHNELFLWSADSHDWQQVGDAQGVAMNVIRELGNMAGGTVLLHDTHPWSVTAAQMIFRWLEQENRERAAAHRAVYQVMDPADFIEGARERLPLIAAAREQERAEARRHRRDGEEDAQAGGAGGEAAAHAAPGSAGAEAPAQNPNAAPSTLRQAQGSGQAASTGSGQGARSGQGSGPSANSGQAPSTLREAQGSGQPGGDEVPPGE